MKLINYAGSLLKEPLCGIYLSMSKGGRLKKKKGDDDQFLFFNLMVKMGKTKKDGTL